MRPILEDARRGGHRYACRQLAKDGGRGRGNLLHLTDLFFMWPLYFTFMMALAPTRYL